MTGKETDYIKEAVLSGKISGDGVFTAKCHTFFEEKYKFKKALLTGSCTAALEMAAMLCDVEPGDEVIVPAFTFVSTANAFVLRGAHIVFADSCIGHPNIDPESAARVITPRTKVIIPVHYAGVACDMDRIGQLAADHNLFVVEDAAQAIGACYKGRPLGSIGQFGAFSFHETKNIMSGEGGMLVLNDAAYQSRAEILWEKGTNRKSFFRGEVEKYEWMDIGSSFLPSEITAAFLYAQLENIDVIQEKRSRIWQRYYDNLRDLAERGAFEIPAYPGYAAHNANMFYLVCRNARERIALTAYLKQFDIWAAFHYVSLHKSPYYKSRNPRVPNLPNADRFSDCLLRLPLYFSLTEAEQFFVIDKIHAFFRK